MKRTTVGCKNRSENCEVFLQVSGLKYPTCEAKVQLCTNTSFRKRLPNFDTRFALECTTQVRTVRQEVGSICRLHTNRSLSKTATTLCVPFITLGLGPEFLPRNFQHWFISRHCDGSNALMDDAKSRHAEPGTREGSTRLHSATKAQFACNREGWLHG